MLISRQGWGIKPCFAHLVNRINVCLLRYTDSLYGHIHSFEPPLSDIREPAACDYGLLDLKSVERTNKIAFWNLA